MPTVSLSTRIADGADVTTSGTNITLTATSKTSQTINMSAVDLTVTLPNATLLNTGVAYVFKATGYIYTVKDASTNNICYVTPAADVTVYLVDNSGSTGSWVYASNNVIKGPIAGITNQIGVVGSYVAVAMLTATRAICAYCGTSTYLQAVVIDIAGPTVTFGTISNVNSIVSAYIDIVGLTTSQAMVVFSGATSYLNAVILNVSGTTITPGTNKVVNAVASYYMSVAMLTSSKAICTYRGTTSYLQAVILDVASSVITNGTVATCNAVASAYQSVAALTATKAICTYTAASNYVSAIILDVATSTITPATAAIVNAVSSQWTSVAMLTSTKAICTYIGLNGYLNTVILDVATSTITPGTIAIVNIGVATYQEVAMLTSTKAICIMCAPLGLAYLQAIILDVATSTITPATPTVMNGTASMSWCSIAALSSTSAICTYVYTSPIYFHAVPIAISSGS